MAFGSAEAAFWDSVEDFGDIPALLTPFETLSFQDLANRADSWADTARKSLKNNVKRPLVLIEAGNATDPIAAYLGALRAGWPVILTEASAAGKTDALSDRYKPNIVVQFREQLWTTVTTEWGPAELGDDLALMLSTSGTTGDSKLVRLSKRNIASNADAIVSYLGQTASDRAITTLPWHYSYGLSVLHTQLAVGGGLVLTDASVVDPAFWETARAAEVSVLPLVPMQFDLLEKRGFDRAECPSLRILTQAGGRLDPAMARRYAEASRREGWSFFVMYGQTEAAPRISYVPKDAPLDAYDTIGRAIPGGTLSVEDETGQDIDAVGQEGELVYRGPNVMMGYAETRADLARPDDTEALRTGDLAMRTKDGFFRIVGRASRFLKINGLRIGLDDVEARLRGWGIAAHCTGTDEQIRVFVTEREALVGLKDRLARDLKLASHQVAVRCLAQIPAMASGKVDYRALNALGDAPDPDTSDAGSEASDLETVLRHALRTDHIDPARSFRDYGGDSLSYLEVEIALGERGIAIADDWDDQPLRVLLDADCKPTGPIANTQPVPLDLVWRIAAIGAVLANHATAWPVAGGAYFLLVLSGYSLARFQSPALFEGSPVRAMKASLGNLLLWYFAILAVVHVAWTEVGPSWWLLVGNYDHYGNDYSKVLYYWYISALVQVVVLTCLPFFIKPVRDRVRAHPFEYGLVALSLTVLAFQMAGVYEIHAEGRLAHTIGALELAMMGWCFYFARNMVQKTLSTVIVFAIVGWHWNDTMPVAQAFITLGTLSLIFSFRLHLPSLVVRGIGYLGGLTLMIYLCHPFVLAVVQRIGIRWSDPNWSNTELYLATVFGTIPVAAAVVMVERRVLRPLIGRAGVAIARIRANRAAAASSDV